ncbi:hypothetical protein DERF_004665 [Dermatophagoides farinae]|uniref:Uncharacterized protein n=1 Tax=Dermatophagoides farinae TaxID=6954 RepID=A0A922LAC7_DERFA|nr:hypothetical protein DERF_004665 [Dermatophagoides farinae]
MSHVLEQNGQQVLSDIQTYLSQAYLGFYCAPRTKNCQVEPVGLLFVSVIESYFICVFIAIIVESRKQDNKQHFVCFMKNDHHK